MFPTIPESFEGMSGAELRALAAEIRKAGETRLAEIDADGFEGDRKAAYAELTAQAEKRKLVLAAAVEAEAREATRAGFADASDDPVEDPGKVSETGESGATAADKVPAESAPGGDEDASDAGDGDDADDDDSAGGGTALAVAPTRVRRQVGAAATVTPPDRVAASQFVAVDGVKGKAPGAAFEDFTDLSQALIARAGNIRPDTSDEFVVGTMKGTFEHKLTESWIENLKLLSRGTDSELTAALCAPFTPNYNLGCMNVTRRPVRASLPTFEAPRMGVKIYPSPTLADITGGFGQWTAAMDADPDNNTKVCTKIVCGTPVDYQMYAVWRCITIQNMLQMSFPELVDAWLNRLAAAQARYAETLLLEAIAAGTDTVFSEDQAYNGSVSVVRAILQYLNAYQELQRWDSPEMEIWLHRGILNAIKADQVARRNTNGDVLRVPTDAEVNALFTNAGVTPHWFLDRPSWMTPLPAFSVGGKLAYFPRNVEMIVAPRGKFALMDGGDLNIGVTGNNLYRDNTSNAHNNFTLFYENFEGVVNTDSCPAHIVELNNVCWNGQQIADVVIDCEGQDEPGIGS